MNAGENLLCVFENSRIPFDAIDEGFWECAVTSRDELPRSTRGLQDRMDSRIFLFDTRDEGINDRRRCDKKTIFLLLCFG